LPRRKRRGYLGSNRSDTTGGLTALFERNVSMPNDTQALEDRKSKLLVDIENDRKSYLRNARWNYFTAQGMSWGSLAASGAAALLGLIPSPSVDKWVVGGLAAISAALIAASRQLGFQQKANWHYRKVDRLRTLQRRLSYELPISPSADNIAAISSALSAIDTDMSKEWEDMQHETETKPKPEPAPPVSG
jgi:hypothetical protein